MTRARWLWILLALLALALLGWALGRVPLGDIADVLGQLSLAQILILLLVNSGIVLLLGLRWWLLLAALGYRLPYIAITRYRLTGFAVSYFTPGPQFGGEVAQVHFARQHGMPGSTAVAAIGMDRLLELLVNFVFLAAGLALVLANGLLLPESWGGLLPVMITLALIPLLYLLALAWGARPFSALGRRLPAYWLEALQATEEQLAGLARQQPRVLGQALGASLLVWAALLFEYWLALSYLGLPLTLLQLVAVVTASRLAMFAPTPGALGALEAAQVLALGALGFDPAFGLSLSLLIRARDVFFGLIGLWWGGRWRI